MTRSIVYKKQHKRFIVAKMQHITTAWGECLQRHTRPAAAATHICILITP